MKENDQTKSEHSIVTYGDLLEFLRWMTEEELGKPIQCILPTQDEDDVQECLQGIAFATVRELGIYKCRSTYDNKYHADDLVILLDCNLHGIEGEIAHVIVPADGMMKLCGDTEERPIYGNGGRTNPKDQMSPEALANHVVESRPPGA